MEKEKWRRARMIAFNAMIGSHLDHKKLPKSEEAFLPLEEKQQKRVDPAIMEELRREREEIFKKINENKQAKQE